jgi:hypothetical protein
MPRYFFSVESPAISSDDEEGEEFPDDAAAIAEAELVRCELLDWRYAANAVIVIRADDGRIVSEVPIGNRH